MQPTTLTMTTTPPPGESRPGPGRAGLTLIELMVAMSILVILTLAASQIVAQAQRVVTIGHASMRNNGKVAALKNVVREDFRRVTPAGFLFIDHGTFDTPPTSSPPPGAMDGAFLAFTTAGPADAMAPNNSVNVSGLRNSTGTGSIVTYGRRTYENPNPANAKVLNRVNVLLNNIEKSGALPYLTGGVLLNGAGMPDATFGTFNNDSDASPLDLANFQSNYFAVGASSPLASAAAVDTVMARIRAAYFDEPPMRLLQEDLLLEDITGHVWKVMTPHVTRLEILWTDGSVKASTITVDNPTGDLNWYGVSYDKNGVATMYSKTINEADPNYTAVEFIDTNQNKYRARWTSEIDPKYWPKAIMIRVTIADDTTKHYTPLYEIICPVGP